MYKAARIPSGGILEAGNAFVWGEFIILFSVSFVIVASFVSFLLIVTSDGLTWFDVFLSAC